MSSSAATLKNRANSRQHVVWSRDYKTLAAFFSEAAEMIMALPL